MSVELKNTDIEKTIQKLRDDLIKDRDNPSNKLPLRRKCERWIMTLEELLSRIGQIDEHILPNLELILGHSIDRNHLHIAMMQPSVKNIFSEIRTQTETNTVTSLSTQDLKTLENLPEAAKSLAWVGDTVIKQAILLKIWNPEITSEELNDARREYESDKNLAKLCDSWKLFEYRIHLDPDVPKPVSAEKVKGTLTESIFGIIFVEQGFDGVQSAFHLIDTPT